MRNSIMGLMVLLIVLTAAGVVKADSPEVLRDAAYVAAREQMADILASEEFEKVDISAGSFDHAMEMIYTSVETYLDLAIPELGDAESAGEFGVDVLFGLNDHKVHYAGDDGVSLAAKRRLLISGEQDAKDLGELLARVAILIHDGHGKPGIDVRKASKRIFQGMLPVQGTDQSLGSQYVVTLRMLSKADEKALVEFALD